MNSMLCWLGFISSNTGRSTLSKDGMGCGAKREAGMAQRSISRSNTDSDPKETRHQHKSEGQTKPCVQPGHGMAKTLKHQLHS
jgi:hypothetical protein